MTTTASPSTSSKVRYNTVRIKDIDVFYRDAGPKDAVLLLLLHGFPTSSNMFRNLIPRLAGSFRVIAPDYPGYGFSGMPDRKDFKYTFANQTTIVEELTKQLGLESYALYVMDYGAPIGYSLALRHPQKITGIIVQNGNAYEEGLLKFWDPIKKYWNDISPENRAALAFLAAPEATKWQYQNGVSDVSLLDPTTCTLDQALMDRPGNGDIQLDMLLDYASNVPLYPDFQAFFRKYQPPMLIVIFPPEGAAPYKRDLPNVETHLLDTGHFAAETRGEEIAERIEKFLATQK
jgi:pimeloyl-ACP methyl ester carboxylesterase